MVAVWLGLYIVSGLAALLAMFVVTILAQEHMYIITQNRIPTTLIVYRVVYS